MTRDELKGYAKTFNIKNVSNLRKNDMVDKIMDATLLHQIAAENVTPTKKGK